MDLPRFELGAFALPGRRDTISPQALKGFCQVHKSSFHSFWHRQTYSSFGVSLPGAEKSFFDFWHLADFVNSK